jgi:integrase
MCFNESSEFTKSGKERGSVLARTIYISGPEMEHILAALMPTNRLVVELCIATGLRVSDALEIKTVKLKRRMTIKEMKTGKTRRVVIPARIYTDMLSNAGRLWVFEGRTDWRKHRTRQTVYKDIKKVSAMFQRSKSVRAGCIGTHTARKMAAVDAYQRGGLDAAQKLLNHSDPAITLIYALADQQGGKKRRAKN